MGGKRDQRGGPSRFLRSDDAKSRKSKRDQSRNDHEDDAHDTLRTNRYPPTLSQRTIADRVNENDASKRESSRLW